MKNIDSEISADRLTIRYALHTAVKDKHNIYYFQSVTLAKVLEKTK